MTPEDAVLSTKIGQRFDDMYGEDPRCCRSKVCIALSRFTARTPLALDRILALPDEEFSRAVFFIMDPAVAKFYARYAR